MFGRDFLILWSSYGLFLSIIPLFLCHSTVKYRYSSQLSTSCQYSDITQLPSINCVNFANRNGKLTLKDLQLVNSMNETIQLRGISSHGIHWFPQCVTLESITYAVMNWGVNLYRIVIYIDSDDDGYESNPSYFDQYIDNIISWCESLGIYVIIDWHVLTPGDPNVYLSSPGASTGLAAEFWTKMATLYKNKPFVLYEIANEPNNVEWSLVLQYHNSIISIIRNIDPQTIILAGTTTWSQDIHLAVDNPVQQPYNIMYSFHFYAATHSFLYNRLVQVSKLIPIFVNEWGFSSASGNDPIDPTTAKLYLDYMSGITSSNSPILSWAVWSYSDKNESSALLNVFSCQNHGWSQTTCSGDYITSFTQSASYGSSCNRMMTSTSSTVSPSAKPTNLLGFHPSHIPTLPSTTSPTGLPSLSPTYRPTVRPSLLPTRSPSNSPSHSPSMSPTMFPTSLPTFLHSSIPPSPPTRFPSYSPIFCPSLTPTLSESSPSVFPTPSPSLRPTVSSNAPTFHPTNSPSYSYSLSGQPSSFPSSASKSSSASESTSVRRLMGPHRLYLVAVILLFCVLLCAISCCLLHRRRVSQYKQPEKMQDNIIITEFTTDPGDRYQHPADHVPLSVNPMTVSPSSRGRSSPSPPRNRRSPSPPHISNSPSEERSSRALSARHHRSPRRTPSPPAYQMTKLPPQNLQAF